MIAIITILLALPLGFFLKSRATANLGYGVAYLWGFVYQGVYLVLGYVDGNREAFHPNVFPLDYGIVAGAIFGVGFGLVNLGHWLGARRRARRRQPAAQLA